MDLIALHQQHRHWSKFMMLFRPILRTHAGGIIVVFHPLSLLNDSHSILLGTDLDSSTETRIESLSTIWRSFNHQMQTKFHTEDWLSKCGTKGHDLTVSRQRNFSCMSRLDISTRPASSRVRKDPGALPPPPTFTFTEFLLLDSTLPANKMKTHFMQLWESSQEEWLVPLSS